jgi:hypothetical protein
MQKECRTMADLEEIIDPECHFSASDVVRVGEAAAGTLPEPVLGQVAKT